MDKPMLNSAQLVKHMQEKGIKFEITTTKDARYMLDNVNYYFKLASYKINWCFKWIFTRFESK